MDSSGVHSQECIKTAVARRYDFGQIEDVKCAVVFLLTSLVIALSPAVAGADTTVVRVGILQNMRALLITPEGPGPHPGILVLHTSGGLQNADIAYARKLAREGYVTLVPAFLEAYGIDARTRRETFTTAAEPIFADLVAALGTLRRHPQVAGGTLGVVGFSNGGYFAVWLAAAGKVQAGVCYYGALTGAATDKSLARFRSAFNKASAPVLILHGIADSTVPVQAAQRLGAIIGKAGSPYEIKLYDGAGHKFERTDGSQWDGAAAADAWQRTLGYFAKYLVQT